MNNRHALGIVVASVGLSVAVTLALRYKAQRTLNEYYDAHPDLQND